MPEMTQELKQGLNLSCLFFVLVENWIKSLVVSIETYKIDSLCATRLLALDGLPQCFKNLAENLAVSNDSVISDYSEFFPFLKCAFINRGILPPFKSEFFDFSESCDSERKSANIAAMHQKYLQPIKIAYSIWDL